MLKKSISCETRVQIVNDLINLFVCICRPFSTFLRAVRYTYMAEYNA